MLRFEWSKAVKRPSPVVLRARRRGPRSPWTRFVPRLDPMEDRTLLSTFVVTSPLDDGSAGTLRSKIAAAHSGDTIDFASSLAGDTITLNPTFGELLITKSLDIEGPGANLLTISGNDASRVFDISGAATTSVTIAGLTIAHGSATGFGMGSSPSDLGGGGILNEANASLTLSQSVLTNNTATANSGTVDVFGGGLLNEGSATVTSCIFSSNKALGGGGTSFFGGSVGGAIDNFGGATLTVTGSTFIKNQAISTDQPGLFFGVGGAIENNAGFDQAHPSTATISNSTFTDNQAIGGGTGSSGNGGAIDNEGTDATMTLTNSRLIDNQSIGGAENNGLGGGILNAQGSKLIVTSSTLIGNQAIGGSGSNTFAFGGGINNTFATLTVMGSSFFGNKALALSPGGIAVGGGIENGALFGPGHLDLTNSTLSGNQATGGSGGGVAAGGGLDNSFFVTATITGSQIINNQALGGAGGPGVNGGDRRGRRYLGRQRCLLRLHRLLRRFLPHHHRQYDCQQYRPRRQRRLRGQRRRRPGRRHLVRPAHIAPTAEQHRQQRDHGQLRPGRPGGRRRQRRPRRWPLRRHQRLGQPEEIARHPELRLHQQRQHLWHGDLPLSATAIFPRQPDFPRTHHRRPGEGPFPLWPFASIGRAVPLAEPSWNPVRGELGNQSPQVTLAESLGKERRGCAGRPRTGLRSSPHDRPGQAT